MSSLTLGWVDHERQSTLLVFNSYVEDGVIRRHGNGGGRIYQREQGADIGLKRTKLFIAQDKMSIHEEAYEISSQP